MAAPAEDHRQEVQLHGVCAEFRTALQEELDAARRASASGAIQLVNGRKIAQVGGAYQYLFLLESALNAPDDSPGDLYVPGAKPVATTIISVEGLAVSLSVPLDLGAFVPRAALQSDLTHLLRKLIERIEDLADKENPAGDRLLGDQTPSGEPAWIEPSPLNVEQTAAVASSIGRDTTFIWGPPGTGKTRTIGSLATELHNRKRSVLLVSHTNAAVDQALLHVVKEIGEEELEQGLVLRLGETKEPTVASMPLLHVQTHVDRRSANLTAERDQLTREQLGATQQLASLDRLIGIAEWLPEAPAEIRRWHDRVKESELLEHSRTETTDQFAALQSELAPWLALREDATRAIKEAERAQELKELLPRLGERATGLSDALSSIQQQRKAAEVSAREAKEHVPRVRAARDRLAALRAELPQREPLLAATEAELVDLAQSIAAAEELLLRAEDSNAITRRLRGIPHLDEQRETTQLLRTRAERLEEARRQTAAGLESLQQEFQKAQETIDQYGHLRDPILLEEEEQMLVTQEQRAGAAATTATDELSRFERELGELGKPLEKFPALHHENAEKVLAELARLMEESAPVEQKAKRLDEQIRAVTQRLREELDERVLKLSTLGLIERVAKGFAAALEQVEEALSQGRELLAGRQLSSLGDERKTVQRRLGEITARLAEIEDVLQRVEELVIAEARLVATTLTRAYKRDSIQARRFDTVVLDEASMAPIPALWVAASLADANVVLVGDFRQLPPIKHSDHELAEKWLGRDVFVASGVRQAFEAGDPPAHFIQLQEQFRMHPAISAIPNHFLYGGALRNGADVEDDGVLDGWYEREWGYDSPVLLVDTGSLNAWVTSVNNAGRTSRLNFLSATACVDIAEMLLQEERPETTGGQARILIGAPYRPHAKLINLLIREHKLDPDVRAGTAHTFQGSEAPVMIFDLVNDEPHWKVAMFMPGLSEDFKRLMNVALTRAQRRLIIVGDFDYISKQGKRAFICELIDFLRERYPIAEAAQLIPAGLSARAARMQIQAKGGDDVEGERLVVTQDSFDHHLLPDLEAAEQRLVIFSPFLTYERVASLEPQLRAAAERGARVVVVTKSQAERGRQLDGYRHIERALTSWGVTVVHKAKMHEKLVFVDEDLLWHGSLNPLSFSNTQEIMERRRSKAVVEDYQKTLRLDELLGAYEQREAGVDACPFCGGEIVATEGRDDPYYWRCVEDSCFSRSIDDPMPRDGMVVCTSAGCGKSVHFGHWGDAPHWRCDENPRHRTRISRSHLRLPKMRALVPERELKTLEKKFGLDGGKPKPKLNGQLDLL